MKRILFTVTMLLLVIVAGWRIVSIARDWKAARTVQGHTMSEWLKILATDSVSFTNALKLKPVITGEEPDLVTYEVPISYDMLTNHNLLPNHVKIHLFADDRLLDTRSYPDRATNGNCLVFWDTTQTPSGSHRIYAEFWLFDMDRDFISRGPTTIFSRPPDICHVNPYITSEYFKGVVLYARLEGSNAAYSIDLQTTDGKPINTITGKTANAIIDERWNLIDEHGKQYTNSKMNAVYHVVLANSISQTKTQLYTIETP